MDNKILDPKSNEERREKWLASLSPLERRVHDARVSAWMMANIVLVKDLIQTIHEMDKLVQSEDEEERELIPYAEMQLLETLEMVPTNGEA